MDGAVDFTARSCSPQRAGLAWPPTTTATNPTWVLAEFFLCALRAAEVAEVQQFTDTCLGQLY